MARSIGLITQNLKAALVSAATAVGLTINPNIWSFKDYKLLTLNSVATQQGIEEQLWDSFSTKLDGVAKGIPVQTVQWFINLLLNVFEYDVTANPIVQFDVNLFQPYYVSPNPLFNVIKYASAKTDTFGNVTFYIAGQSAGIPNPLSSPTIFSAKSFIKILGVDGVNYNVLSPNADLLLLKATINYNGSYSATIQNDVATSINGYLNSLNENGTLAGVVIADDLLSAIRNTHGVNGCVLNNVAGKPSAGSYTYLVSANLWIQQSDGTCSYNTNAGYINIDPSNPLTSTLTFISE